MAITIDFLKDLVFDLFDKINPLLGTQKAAEKFKRGAGGDISMYIDIVAENAIIDYLEKASKDVLLISEEIGEKVIGDKESINKTKKKIIIDPIDGSNNAIRGVPFCSVSIAYAEGDTLDDISKGIILDLTTKDIYWAEKGRGAYLNDKRIYVSERDITQNCLLELNIPRKKLIEIFEIYNTLFSKFYKIRVMGSTALTLCQIAKGSIDAFFDLINSNRLVDVAAGLLILKEAGGSFFSKNGTIINESLSINTRFPFIASNNKLEDFLKNSLKKIN